MYARYIPPSKGENGQDDAATSAQVFPSFIPPTLNAPEPISRPSDGLGYARYIPGSKIASNPVESPSIQYFNEETNPPPTPKRKRDVADDTPVSEKKKSKKTRAVNRTESTEDDAAQAVDSDDQAKGATLNTKKSSKDKKKKKSKSAELEDVEDELQEPKSPNGVAEGSKKRSKKERRTKQVVTEDADEDDDVQMEDAEPAVKGDSTLSPEDEIRVEKKAKKEKKKKANTALEAEEDGGVDQRHKAVFERRAKSLNFTSKHARDSDDDTSEGEEEELHGLEPLPQPEPVAVNEAKPAYDTLPSWLSAPLRVSQDTRIPFVKLGILPKAARVLQEKGYEEAFAVQTAAIPLLLPTSKQRPGDVLVSAATGSGKTLAYALPIVRDLSQGVVTRLRTLVVLPTRELVKQAQDVFELCAKAYEGTERKRVRIGVAIGSQSIKSEQEALLETETRYDPEAYRLIQEEREQKQKASVDGLDDDSDERDPRLGPWEGEVVDFMSKVDILICTPGRLVEHMDQTPGFSLDYVRWLVVDEADKLLAQSFQGWLDLVMEKFQTSKFSARDFPDMAYSGVRKVILSATLTRDLSLLSQLSLQRPQLIVLENEGDVQVAEHTLPATLKEFAIRVHNTNLKPMYLLDLLWSQDMKASGSSAGARVAAVAETAETADSDTSSDGSSDSESDSDSDSDADSDSSSGSSSDASSDTSSDSSSDSDSDASSETSSTASSPKPKIRESQIPISLIFTKSNEAALRLSRLLALLDKSLAPHISTITSTTPTHIRRKALRAFTTPSSPIRLIIASDLVARGIDIPKLGNVINYDLPPSVAAYVHRVGRTARAGRSGCAWTLVGDDESGWFWGKIAKGASVRRAQKVGRVIIDQIAEDRVPAYEDALEQLGKEALEKRRR